MSDEDRDRGVDSSFQQLLIMLASAAMQNLGKVVNPASGRAEVDLDGAQIMIDLIEMIERKTRNNLTRDEGRLLGDTLTMLRLNYVETAKSGGAGSSAPESRGVGGAAAPAGEESRIETPPASPKPPDEGGPRFHKTYG